MLSVDKHCEMLAAHHSSTTVVPILCLAHVFLMPIACGLFWYFNPLR
jgi:hypothetical protein